ncbi:solute carrier family 22 member 13-like [Centropristis striata]|uniref:solute carrier family 22 member 13-like n=1 Tax=Centropristis striata TaxID=184440 RepID=UPI0027E18BE7|nr:solute carrier family 22 member 13-like [Centropristis striata]
MLFKTVVQSSEHSEITDINMAEFGEILQNIGEFGLFQKLILVSLCGPNFIQNFLLASLLFIQSDPERHCNTDWILQADSNLTTDEQLNLTLPREEDGTFSRCQMFVPVDWDIGDIREYGLNETTGCHNGWVYGNSLYEATIVTDFDLVCDKAKLVETIQAVFLGGSAVGVLIFGPFAESFGRKRVTQAGAVIAFIFCVTTALCPNVYLYIASQFLLTLGFGGYRLNCIILVTEWIGPSKRSWGSCVALLCVAIGQCILAGVAYAIRHWRLTQLITAVPLAVLASSVWFIPESARWLLSRGRTEEAKQLIVKAATINKRTVPDSLLEKIVINDAVQKGGIKIIFRSSILTRYLFIVGLAWFSMTLGYFSLYFNMETFGLSIFLTQLLFGAIEIPANLLAVWLLEVIGRRISYISTLLAGGLASILMLAVPEGHAIALTSLAVAARFFFVWAGSVAVVFTQELFPTSVRQSATALAVMSGRLGALLAPLLNILSIYHWSIPITVLSSLTLISGALGFLLPETRRKELPESTEEAENNRNVTSTKTESLEQESTKL